MTKKAMIVGAAAHIHLAEAAVALTPATEKMFRAAYATGDKDPIDAPESRRFEPIGAAHDLPDRISIDRGSPFYTNCGAYLLVMFNGEEAKNCVEFCVSGGWVRLGPPGVERVTAQQVKEAPMMKGEVEVSWRTPPSRQIRRQLARIGR